MQTMVDGFLVQFSARNMIFLMRRQTVCQPTPCLLYKDYVMEEGPALLQQHTLCLGIHVGAHTSISKWSLIV